MLSGGGRSPHERKQTLKASLVRYSHMGYVFFCGFGECSYYVFWGGDLSVVMVATRNMHHGSHQIQSLTRFFDSVLEVRVRPQPRPVCLSCCTHCACP